MIFPGQYCGTITVFNVSTRKRLAKYKPGISQITKILWGSDPSHIIIHGESSLVLVDYVQKSVVKQLEHISFVASISSGRLAAIEVKTGDTGLKILHAKDFELDKEFELNNLRAARIVTTDDPDVLIIYSAANSNTPQNLYLRISDGTIIFHNDFSTDGGQCKAFSDDGKLCLTDKSVRTLPLGRQVSICPSSAGYLSSQILLPQ